MEEQIVKLTGRPVSEEMRDILNRLSRKESVEIDEINNTREIKTARSNVDYSRPTIQLDNRFEIQANALNQMNKLGSATIDENGNTIYNGDVAKGSRLDIIIGLPASGKSSAIVDSLSQEFHSKVIDNDEAKKMIPQYNNGWGAGVVHEESQKISDVAFRIALAKHENVILPKVGSNAGRLLSDYIEPAAEVGYKVNVHFVDLDRNKALGRMINRFIEEGRFLDPNLIDNYCNEREGNKIEKAYEQLKESDFVQGFSRWDNDVERGEKPILVEYSNLEGNYIDNARTGDVNYERENEHTKGSRTNSGNSRESRGNEPQSSHANESGQRTDNSRYDTGRSFNDNGQILQEGQLREKEKIAAEIAEFIAINENAKYWHNEFADRSAIQDTISKELQDLQIDKINSRIDHVIRTNEEYWSEYSEEELSHVPAESITEVPQKAEELKENLTAFVEKINLYEIDILITEQSKNIHIEGHKGTYSVVQSDIIDGQKAYLLKSDIESDEMEISDIVCDEKGNVLLNEVWANGLDEYKSNIFFDRNQLSEEIIHEWEEENDMKISNELDSMIYDLSHDHSLTKEKFAEMVYQIIEDFENKIVSPLEVTHLLEDDVIYLNNGHKLELNHDLEIKSLEDELAAYNWSDGYLENFKLADVKSIERKGNVIAAQPLVESDNQMSILSTEQFMEDVSAGVSGITLNGTILSETANYTNFSNRVYNVVQEYEDNKDNTDIVQTAQNIYFDTSVGQIALADIEIPSGKYNLGEDYYIANIEGIETNYTAAFSAFEIAGVRINDIYLSTQSTNPEYKMVLAKMEQENEKSAFRCYQANDKQGYNVLFTQDTTMEHEKQIGFFIEDTSGVAIASGVAAMSNHAGAKLITEEFGIFGKDSDVVFYEINDKAEVADIEQRSTQIENLPIKVECEQHSGSEVIAQDVTYCADNATASSYAEYISNIPNNNTDMHINIAVRSDIEEKEIREMLESTEQYRAYKFFDSVDEEIDFLVIESDKDTKQVNISIYDNNLDKVSETTLSYPNEAAFGATQKEFSLSNLMNSQEFQNAPDKGYIEKTFNQVWKFEKVNAEELMSDINDKHALEVGKEIVDKANFEKGDRILTLYDKQTGKVNFQQSFNDLSEVNLFDLQLAAKGWDRYEVTDTENKILVKGEVDSDMESIIEDTLTQLDSPDTDEMVGRYTITLYDKETGSIQFQQFFDEVSELDIDELRHSIDGDNYFEIEDEKGIVLTEGNVDGDMLEIIKSSLLMSNNDRTADMELTAAKQAENLINQLEGNATIFTNEERNLIVNYAYKFDDMEKTKELAEKIAYLQTEDEPSEKVAVIKKANKEIDMLPDSMVGLSEMHEYGYTWEEMLPLTQERAAELFDENVAVYQLYSDGSETLVENVQDVKEDERNFQLMFGVEKKDWKAYLENDIIKKDNPLNKVEELVEGNYNQIDGIINNTPPLEEDKEEKELTFKERIAQAKEQSDKTEQSRENKKERPSHSAPSLD